MAEQATGSDQYRTMSPWPIFVALGIPISELGVLFNVFPVAVAGLLLFSGSISGMLREAGYTANPWRPLLVLAGLLVVVGAIFVFTSVDLVTRGHAILTAAGILLLVGVGGELFAPSGQLA
ncbi:MAG: cox cluster protein [Haloplanus sp.]